MGNSRHSTRLLGAGTQTFCPVQSAQKTPVRCQHFWYQCISSWVQTILHLHGDKYNAKRRIVHRPDQLNMSVSLRCKQLSEIEAMEKAKKEKEAQQTTPDYAAGLASTIPVSIFHSPPLGGLDVTSPHQGLLSSAGKTAMIWRIG